MSKQKLGTLTIDTRFRTCLTQRNGLVLRPSDETGELVGPHRLVLLTWDGPNGLEQRRKVVHGAVVVEVAG